MSLRFRSRSPSFTAQPAEDECSTILLRYLVARNVKWYLVESRIRTHPVEASQKDIYGATPLYRAVARRVDNYPRLQTIQLLLDAFPGAMICPPNEFCPMNAACWRRAPYAILQLLIDARPSRDLNVHDLCALWSSYERLFGGDTETLVQYVCEGGRDGAQIWAKLHAMLHYCSAQKIRDWNGLHAAASVSSCSLQVLQLSFRLFPEQVRLRDKYGRMPLHVILDSCNSSEIEQGTTDKMTSLLEWFPEACTIRDGKGRLPLHIAVETGRSWEQLKRLIYASPDALSQRNFETSLYPFQMAASCEICSLTVVYELLRSAPHLVSVATEIIELSPIFATNSIVVSIPVVHDVADTNEALLQDALTCYDSETWMLLSRLLRCRHKMPKWRTTHAAASLPRCPVGILILSTKLYPHELLERSGDGKLPIHYITSHELSSFEDDTEHIRTRALQLVLESCTDTASYRDSDGHLPLHLAIKSGQPWASLEMLIHAYPGALFVPENGGLLPYQYAAAVPHDNIDQLYRIILAAPHLLDVSSVAN